jgi:hypothetical protein
MKGAPSLREKMQFWKKKGEAAEGLNLIGTGIFIDPTWTPLNQHCTVLMHEIPLHYNLADVGSGAAEDVRETEEQLVERRKKEKAEVLPPPPPPHLSDLNSRSHPLCNAHERAD